MRNYTETETRKNEGYLQPFGYWLSSSENQIGGSKSVKKNNKIIESKYNLKITVIKQTTKLCFYDGLTIVWCYVKLMTLTLHKTH